MELSCSHVSSFDRVFGVRHLEFLDKVVILVKFLVE